MQDPEEKIYTLSNVKAAPGKKILFLKNEESIP